MEGHTASGKRETQFHSGEGDTFDKKGPDAATMASSPQHRSPMPILTHRPPAPETSDHREPRGLDIRNRETGLWGSRSVGPSG